MTLSLQIASDIEKAILEGKLRPNDKLPSISETGKKYSVSHITVLRAYRELESKNLIVSKKGIGNFVKPFCSVPTKTGRIGVFTRPQRIMEKLDNYFNCINIGIETAASEFRLDILRSHSSAAFNQYRPVPGLLESVADDIVKTEPLVDGFIIDERFPDEQLFLLLPRLTKPVVIVNRTTALPVCSVSNDNDFALSNIIGCALNAGCTATLFIAQEKQSALDPALPFDRYSCVLKAAERIPELAIIENVYHLPKEKTVSEIRTLTERLLKKHQKILLLAETEFSYLLFQEALSDASGEHIFTAGMAGLNLHDETCYQGRFCNSIPDTYAMGQKAVSLLADPPAQPERAFIKPKLYLGSIRDLNIFNGGSI